MQLVVEQGELTGRVFVLEGGPLVAGRGQGSELLLPETGVSRQHARFEPGPRGWVLVDLGSTNGTFVNGQRLPAEQPYLLRPGDRIAIGSTVFSVQPGKPAVGPASQAAHEHPTAPDRPRPQLLVVSAVGLVVVLAGLVILVVTLLQPEPGPVTPTVAGPLEQMATALPLPSGLEGVMTSVVTLVPQDLPLFPLGPTSTPTPEARRPGREMAQRPAEIAAPLPLPQPAPRPGQARVVP